MHSHPKVEVKEVETTLDPIIVGRPVGLTPWGVSSNYGVTATPNVVVGAWLVGGIPDLVVGPLATLFLFLC